MLLRKLTFSNFYSFKEPQTISFLVDKNAPDTSAYVESVTGERVSKVLGVFGANASGKTNLLKAIGFLRHFISDSFKDDPEESIMFEPFLFTEKENTTDFDAEFEIEDTVYQYLLKLDRSKIYLEQLRIRDNKSKRFSNVFVREYNEATDDYIYKTPKLNLPKKFLSRIRKNASLISTSMQLADDEILEEVELGWGSIFTNVINSGNIEIPIQSVAEHGHKNKEMLESVTNALKGFDFGLKNIEVRELEALDSPDKESETVLVPFVYHSPKSKGGLYSLPIFSESRGTQKIFPLVYVAKLILKFGGIGVLDELESTLHPHVIVKLVEMFLENDENSKHSQLLFSCHYSPVMNDLDKQQIYLVEKDEDLESEAYRLDEVEGVRNDDNYFGKYIAGVYGATPEIL